MLNNSLIPTRTEEIAERVFQPDVLADHEYLDTCRRKNHLEPEKNLIFAMLEDAVRCYQAYAFAKSPMSRRQFRDAEKWLWKNDWQWIFSLQKHLRGIRIGPVLFKERTAALERSARGN